MRPTTPLLKRFYAVAKGDPPGVYSAWRNASRATKDFPGQAVKSFPQHHHAQAWILKYWIKDATQISCSHTPRQTFTQKQMEKLKKKNEERMRFYNLRKPSEDGEDIRFTREEIIEAVTRKWEKMKSRDASREEVMAEAELARAEKELHREEKKLAVRPTEVVPQYGGQSFLIRKTFIDNPKEIQEHDYIQSVVPDEQLNEWEDATERQQQELYEEKKKLGNQTGGGDLVPDNRNLGYVKWKPRSQEP